MGDFLSDQDTWVDWAGAWSGLRDTYKLSDAIRAAEGANNILQSAGDVSGPIYGIIIRHMSRINCHQMLKNQK